MFWKCIKERNFWREAGDVVATLFDIICNYHTFNVTWQPSRQGTAILHDNVEGFIKIWQPDLDPMYFLLPNKKHGK